MTEHILYGEPNWHRVLDYYDDLEPITTSVECSDEIDRILHEHSMLVYVANLRYLNKGLNSIQFDQLFEKKFPEQPFYKIRIVTFASGDYYIEDRSPYIDEEGLVPVFIEYEVFSKQNYKEYSAGMESFLRDPDNLSFDDLTGYKGGHKMIVMLDTCEIPSRNCDGTFLWRN